MHQSKTFSKKKNWCVQLALLTQDFGALTFSIMTFSTMDFIVTLRVSIVCYHAEWCYRLIVVFHLLLCLMSLGRVSSTIYFYYNVMTFSIMTFSLMAFRSIMDFIMTLSLCIKCVYAECRVLFIVMLNVIMMSVVILNVVAPWILAYLTSCFWHGSDAN